MRKLLLVLSFVVALAAPLPASRAADDLPEFRPALIGTFHRSLANIIDAQGLVKKGQRDAVVFFTCAVAKNGDGGQFLVYRGTPGSELLQKELLRLSYRTTFIPAVFNHHAVPVNFPGTVVFVVRDGQPHLRIFMHQEEADFKTDADFVAPQLALVKLDDFYRRPLWPKTVKTKITGAVALINAEVDMKGQVTGAKVAFEHPEGMGFGEEGLRFIRKSEFIPGFRNGKLVACRFDFPVFWAPGRGRKMTIQ